LTTSKKIRCLVRPCAAPSLPTGAPDVANAFNLYLGLFVAKHDCTLDAERDRHVVA
jgi:hypothetical protein